MGNGEKRLPRFVGEVLFWGGLVAVGGWVFFQVFMPAVDARRETRDWVKQLRQENAALRAERERAAVRAKALEDGERTSHEQALRNLGLVPPDRVRILAPDAPDSPPPGIAPPAERPK